MKPLKYLFCLLFLNISLGQTSLPIDLTNFNIEQGLSNYRVYSIFKGQNGFVWIGTENGLNRFDGTSFKLYQNDPNNESTISKGTILDIKQDSDGIIWFVTDGGGLNRLNPTTQKIKRFFDGPEHVDTHFSYMKDLVIDGDNIWLATWGGLIRFNRITEETKVLKWENTNNQLINDDIKSLALTTDGLLWVGTTYGISVLNTKNLEFVDFEVITTYNTKHHLDVRTLYMDHSNNLWVGKIGFLVCINLHKNTITYHTLNPDEVTSNIINCFTEDDNDHLWVGTENGVYISNQKTKDEVVDFNKSMLPSLTVHSLLLDSTKKTWIGTGNDGFFINNNRQKKIVAIPLDDKGNTGKEIRSIIELNKTELLFSTYGHGIVKYNTETQETITLLKETYLSNCKITALLKVDETIWFGTIYNGLFVYDLNKQSFVQIDKNEAIISLCKDNNKVWVGTGNGVRVYNKNTFEKIADPSGNQIPKNFFSDYIIFVYKDKSNNIWISSAGSGICVIDNFYHLKNRINFKNGKKTKPHNYISIYEDQSNQVYLGMNNGRIHKINNNKEEPFFSGDNNIEITGIAQDHENNFWISSTKGFYLKHKGSTNAFNYFGKNEGLNSYQFFHQSVYKDPNGKIYFGGSNGVNCFNPKDVVYQENRKKTIIKKLSIYNKAINLDTITTLKKEITLDYNQNFITINYSNLGFEKKGNYFYKYVLKGLSDDWITVQNQNTVSFTNLSPGKYEFIVQSANNFGVWDSTPASIKLNILPPFWMTWWFNFIAISIVLGGVLLFISNREKKLIVEKELAVFKLQALRSQMNPHFIFNSLNSIQHFIIKNESRFALDYLTKFSKLVRRILDNSMVNKISLSDEISFLRDYVEIESLRFTRDIKFKLIVADDIEVELIKIPAMLIQPYVENAIIHGLMNKKDDEICILTIEFKSEGTKINCEITDNGIGRKASRDLNQRLEKNHTSHGLSITKRRLETLNKQKEELAVHIDDLHDPNNRPLGTKITISIPIV